MNIWGGNPPGIFKSSSVSNYTRLLEQTTHRFRSVHAKLETHLSASENVNKSQESDGEQRQSKPYCFLESVDWMDELEMDFRQTPRITELSRSKPHRPKYHGLRYSFLCWLCPESASSIYSQNTSALLCLSLWNSKPLEFQWISSGDTFIILTL